MLPVSWLFEVRGYPFSFYCQTLNLIRPLSGTVEALFQDALIHVENRAAAYTTHLKFAIANRDYPENPLLPLTRRKVCIFFAINPDPTLDNVIHVFECEFAAQQTMPVWAMKQFVERKRGQAVLDILKTFATNMIVKPLDPAPLKNMWGASKFVVIDLCVGTEAKLIELYSWWNCLSGGRLLSLTQGDLDLKFQALRLEASDRREIALGGTVYKITRILGSEKAEGRKFLTCKAISKDGQKPVVLRFGAHPSSCPLVQDPQMALRYAQELDREGDYDWPYPPILANEIIEGVSISDFLFVLNFEKWKNKPLTFSQETLVRKVGRLLVRCRDHEKIPRSSEEFKKLGIKPSGEDGVKFLQTAPIAMRPFTWERCEEMKRLLSGEGITLFQLMSEDLKVDEEANWELSRRVREIRAALIDTGALPKLREDDQENYIDQRNKISAVMRHLTAKGYNSGVTGKLIGHWLQYTNVTLIEAWSRLESDIEGLLIAQEQHDYELPHDLTPLLNELKVMQGKAFEPPPPSQSKYLSEWVESLGGFFKEE